MANLPGGVPTGILQQHVAVLGKTRSGKSSVMRGLVEQLLEEQKPVCIIDPKGDWWGLKLAKDGKSAGYPVVIFGGEHADIPINEHAGTGVAELFATGNRPCLIDLGGWTVAARTRFWIDFASTLFKHTKGHRWLVVDEVHNFAPKGKVFDAEAGKALHWTNRLASEGLGKGLTMLFASQRPQKVHNDTLTSAETLIAMRVLHPSDRGAVADWIKGCGDSEGSEVLTSLAQMERGEGWVWSPEIGFGPVRVKFPLFKTYDSFRPQSVEDTKRLKGWAEVDLEEVRSKLATVVEQAKADDPKELKRQIQALQLALKNKPQIVANPVAVRDVEKPVLKDAQLQRLDDQVARFFTALEKATAILTEPVKKLRGSLDELSAAVKTVKQPVLPIGNPPRGRSYVSAPVALSPLAAAVKRTADHIRATGEQLDGAQQKILDVVFMLGERGIKPTRESIASWLSIHPNGGRYGSNLARLRELGYLAGAELTEEGRALVRPMALGLETAKEPLDGAQRTIVDVLNADSYPHTRESLATKLGIHPNGGRYGSNLARLRVMGLIPERGEIYLTEAALR